jgi:hypothetical protein
MEALSLGNNALSNMNTEIAVSSINSEININAKNAGFKHKRRIKNAEKKLK